ncbi:hypothetical protein Ddye_012708 [Dipteronia dyeriana]|uniref:Uncharacterized protein n=1 Tax=Dipteronia dyeriana TaxID=168575 RepID=A0AAD9X530_9ROSI|nr:hypothetical protein Ddye_012708 [Dipteronia dyeriana]
MLLDQQLSLVCLVETRVRKTNTPLVVNSIFKNWDILDNYSSHDIGRIWVGWYPRILKISKISETDQIIHCLACILDSNDQFNISFVYGSNDERARRALWDNMCVFQHGGTPWIIVRDFNVSRRVQESVGGSSKISVAMEKFDNCLQSVELDDLRFSGFLHTWCNKRSNGCISKKLDRVLVNKERMAKFEHSEAFFLPPSISDHIPSLQSPAHSKGNEPTLNQGEVFEDLKDASSYTGLLLLMILSFKEVAANGSMMAVEV